MLHARLMQTKGARNVIFYDIALPIRFPVIVEDTHKKVLPKKVSNNSRASRKCHKISLHPLHKEPQRGRDGVGGGRDRERQLTPLATTKFN